MCPPVTVLLLLGTVLFLLPYFFCPTNACCGGCCCGGCGCGCCNYGHYQPQVPAIIPVPYPVNTNNNNNGGLNVGNALRYNRYTNSFSYDNNNNLDPYGSDSSSVYGSGPPSGTNQLSALVAQLQRQAAVEKKTTTTTTTTTTPRPTTISSTSTTTTTTTTPAGPPAWLSALFDRLQFQNIPAENPTTTSTSSSSTTTTTTTTITPSTMSPLVAQLSDEQLQAVLQALVDQHASLFQRPTTTTTTTTTPATPTTQATPLVGALSEEQQQQLLGIMQSLGLRSRGAPEELLDLIAQDSAAAGGQDSENSPVFSHAMPRLLSLLGDENSDPNLVSTTSSPDENSTTPKPLIPVNLPPFWVPPADKDEFIIRENVFAWENGALTVDELGIRRPEFDLAELGGYEKLNPAPVEEEDTADEMDDAQLQNALMDFYYKFDAYDARWGAGVDAEDGPETVLRWRGEDEDARVSGESAEGEEKESEDSAENEEEGYLHRVWKKFF